MWYISEPLIRYFCKRLKWQNLCISLILIIEFAFNDWYFLTKRGLLEICIVGEISIQTVPRSQTYYPTRKSCKGLLPNPTDRTDYGIQSNLNYPIFFYWCPRYDSSELGGRFIAGRLHNRWYLASPALSMSVEKGQINWTERNMRSAWRHNYTRQKFGLFRVRCKSWTRTRDPVHSCGLDHEVRTRDAKTKLGCLIPTYTKTWTLKLNVSDWSAI